VDFHKLADSTLETLELNVTSLEDSIDGFDLSLAMGVLTLSLGAKGTYVFNKQTPNKQIWWSSPLSGPRRYAWDAGKQRWVSTRDGHDMLNTLEGELKGLLGKAVQFK
jgi:frataxin